MVLFAPLRRKLRQLHHVVQRQRYRALHALFDRFPPLRSFALAIYRRRKRIAFAFFLIAHIAGLGCSLHALMQNRTPQGAAAWVVGLNANPYIGVPAYIVFGDSDIEEIDRSVQAGIQKVDAKRQQITSKLQASALHFQPEAHRQKLYNHLTNNPGSFGNQVKLLINGEDKFDHLLEQISQAEHYVLLEYYIIRDDKIGKRLQRLLLDRVEAGVSVYVLFDELGSFALPESYVQELRKGGVHVNAFHPAIDDIEEMRLNFRNHRKIAVIDGKIAFAGGINVGDEYIEATEELGFTRDTHVAIRGPAVAALQSIFQEDWCWVTGDVLDDLNWDLTAAAQDGVATICLPTGPSDALDAAELFFVDAINQAEERVWIATPYFVPSAPTIFALQLAALRGIDVRVLIPENGDLEIVEHSAYAFLPRLDRSGAQLWHYQPGFLHQKVMLIDDSMAAIGSANFDNRSFHLNFETTLLFEDREFAGEVEQMLEADFERSKRVSVDAVQNASWWFRLKVRLAHLFAPLQ